MKKMVTMMGLVSAGVVSAQLAMPLVARAAQFESVPAVQYVSTTLSASGAYLAFPKHVVANDPWSGHSTSWVPVYYLQEALKGFSVATTWNGNVLTVTSVPSTWHTLGSAHYQGNPPSGQMQFAIDGAQSGYERAPKLVAKDPASGVYTTYVPVYYANFFLNNALQMGASWNGSTWVISPQATGGITRKTYSSWATAGEQVQSVNGYLDFPNGDPTVNLGYGITARTDAAMMHAGFEWTEGRWKVEVLYYTKNQGAEQLAESVVAYLHSHALPAPNTQGVILISSTTSPTSTAINPKTTAIWQEGNNVYEYDTIQSPTQALQTVVNSNHS